MYIGVRRFAEATHSYLDRNLAIHTHLTIV